MTRHRSRTGQFLQGFGMDAKQGGGLLAVQEWLEFWKLSSWRHWFAPARFTLERCYLASREWCLRQLFEQFPAHAIEPPFFHDVEIGFYTDRFVKGQLPLPHVPDVVAVKIG